MKMTQLDKWNNELERLSKKRYKRMDNELYNAYKDGLKQLKLEIKQYIDAYDSLSFSQRLQVERQLQVATQINDVINEMGGKEERLLRSFISDEGTQGYFGTFYALEGAENIQLNFAMLPEDYIAELVNTPVAGKRLSTRLYTNQSKLAQEATNALLQGSFRGEGYAKVAKRVGELTEANYKQALRIARTEGGRVQSTAKQRSYVEAKNKGIDIQKRWLSTLDKKTRHSHQELDGQTVGIDEKFKFDGMEADGPRLFGNAGLDINCRCTTIAVVNGISPESRKDNESKELIKYANYKDWAAAKGYESPTVKERVRFNADSILSKTNLREKVGEKNYNKFIEHLDNVQDERILSLFEKYGDQVNVEYFSKSQSGVAHARGSQLKLKQDSFDGTEWKNSFTTVYHEYGHAFDTLGLERVTGKTMLPTGETKKVTILRKRKTVDINTTHLSGDPKYKLKENIKRDLWEYANGKGTPMLEDLGTKPRKRAEKALWDEKYTQIYREGVANFKKFETNIIEKYGVSNPAVAPLSDIYGGTEFTQNAFPFGYGHKKDYWKGNDRLETPDGHELMKEVFPNAIKSWEQLVDDMLGAD